MDSAPLVDHDDRGWFASTHRANLNQKARIRWEDGSKPKVLYLSWRDLSLVWSDHVSTIHTCKSVFLFPPPGFIPDFATALTTCLPLASLEHMRYDTVAFTSLEEGGYQHGRR